MFKLPQSNELIINIVKCFRLILYQEWLPFSIERYRSMRITISLGNEVKSTIYKMTSPSSKVVCAIDRSKLKCLLFMTFVSTKRESRWIVGPLISAFLETTIIISFSLFPSNFMAEFQVNFVLPAIVGIDTKKKKRFP